MKPCPNCGTQIIKTRQICRDCAKEKQWEDIQWGEANLIFPPRIVKNLKSIEIKLDKKDIKIDSGLFLYGPAGSGKTMYSAVLLMELKKQSFLSDHSDYIYGKFVDVLNLLELLRGSFNEETSKTSQQLITEYSEMDVLILDDLGIQNTTPWVLQTLNLIINNRYENLKTTIITSNFDLNQLSQQFGDMRIPDRISEMCRIKCFDKQRYRV